MGDGQLFGEGVARVTTAPHRPGLYLVWLSVETKPVGEKQ